jgi:YHS domain-containing protein
MRRLILAVLTVAVALTSGSNVSFAAKAPKDKMMKSAPAIGGYCPVAYVAAGKALKGDAKFASKHMGRTYWFVSADAKKLFDDAPAKYTIAYDGYCATAVAEGIKVHSDPTQFTVRDGVSYLFYNADAKKLFDDAPEKFKSEADANWPKVSKLPVKM